MLRKLLRLYIKMVSKKSLLGKKLAIAFEEAGTKGLIPSDALEMHNPNWDKVRKTLAQWEDKGKIICIEKKFDVSNMNRYVLSKYAQVAQTD